MEVKIGVQHAPRELSLESAQTPAEVEQGCIAAVTDTIISDTKLSSDRAELLASGLVGAAGQSAQFWLANGRRTPKAEAESLVAALIWRGIASFPLQGGATSGSTAEIG